MNKDTQNQLNAIRGFATAITNATVKVEMAMQKAPSAPEWMDARVTKPATDDELAVVVTKDGAKYFGRTINGKWQQDIAWWLPLPELPKTE